MAKRGWDLVNVAPQANFRPASFVPCWDTPWSSKVTRYASKTCQTLSTEARISLRSAKGFTGDEPCRPKVDRAGADAGEWGRAWLPAQAPGQSRTMGGGCEQVFSASVASPLSETASLFSPVR